MAGSLASWVFPLSRESRDELTLLAAEKRARRHLRIPLLWVPNALAKSLEPAGGSGEKLPVSSSEISATATFLPASERIIAVGDVHGDLGALKSTLRAAGVIDHAENWTGGSTTVVQVGDQLDRGDEERGILDLLFRLQQEAPKAGGGAVHVLLGNHELMNVEGDFRYVTPGGFLDFAGMMNGKSVKKELSRESKVSGGGMVETIKKMPEAMQPRALMFRPGGPLASTLLSRANVALVIGDTVFVHGGLSPAHVSTGPGALEHLNDSTRAYLQGRGDKPTSMRGGKSPVWMRNYSRATPRDEDCMMLNETLRRIPGRVRRMVVGHTPQLGGINSACGGKVWRVDTGMSSAYGGPAEALEITPKRIRIITMKGTRSSSSRTTRH